LSVRLYADEIELSFLTVMMALVSALTAKISPIENNRKTARQSAGGNDMRLLLLLLLLLLSTRGVVASPLPFSSEFRQAASRHHVPVALLRAVCSVESSLNPDALVLHDGSGHSFGLCQVQENAARDVGIRPSKSCEWAGPSCNLWQPALNIEIAARYLAFNYKRYGRSWSSAIVSYNAGSVRRRPDGRYTNQRYLDKVIARLAFYGDKFLEGGK
jgi:soluble lytic murein transglycosylase-like protein